MEFEFDINALLMDIITVVDGRFQMLKGNRFVQMRQQLYQIIDKMGEASAKAQGLTGTITTGRKLEMSKDQLLYIMKDPEGSRGLGAVVGILKVGRKKLFVYDRHGQQWELDPLCVLDFYVHESRQRQGCGRCLFDFMLKNENIAPQHLAIDRPSPKLFPFLDKHYQLNKEIPQVNNFVIFEGFFNHRNDVNSNNRRSNCNKQRSASHPGRELGTEQQVNGHGVTAKYTNSNQTLVNTNISVISSPTPSGKCLKSASGCNQHQSQQSYQEMPMQDLNINPRSANNFHAASFGAHRMTPRGDLSNPDPRSVSAGYNVNNRGMQLQTNMYSRHQPISPSPEQPSSDPSASHSIVNLAQRPPSGRQSNAANRIADSAPPLLRRNGPPTNYLASLNAHHTIQGRGGHLIVPSDPRIGITNQLPVSAAVVLPVINAADKTLHQNPPENLKQPLHSYTNGYFGKPTFQNRGDTSWTVFEVLRNQHRLSNWYNAHNKLW